MSNPFVFANFLETELLEDVTAAALTLHITPSQAAKLPLFAAGASDARLVIWDGTNSPEIVKVTDNPQTGYLTVVRAQESTTSRNWSAGSQVVCSLTAEVINSALQAYFDYLVVLNANFLKLTGGTLTGPLVLSGDPTLPLHAATKQYADSVIGDKLPIAGGTMLGSINMNGNRLLNIPVPVSTTEPIRKQEYDDNNTSLANITTNNSGQLSTAGTSTAYTVTPVGAAVSSLVDGMTFSARTHTTNDDAPTMLYGSTSAKTIRAVLGQTLPAHFMQAGIAYDYIYDLASDSWLIKGAFRSVTRVRAGDFKMSAIEVDHDDCLLCDGRALNRVTDVKLFNAIGTKYGIGDGVTTFNIPDQSGFLPIGRDINSAITFTTNLSTTSGLNTATVASAANLAIGMYPVGHPDIAAGVTITDISGTTVTLSAVATGTHNVATKFSTVNDSQTTGKTGGAMTRFQSRREVGQHLHNNTVSEVAHLHGLGVPVQGNGTGGPTANARQGDSGSSATTFGMSTATATAGVGITNVDSTTPTLPINITQRVMVTNFFIYRY